MHGEVLSLLFLQARRETEAHFTAAGMSSQRNQSDSSRFKRAVAGGCIRSQGNYYCLPPAGVLHSQNKVIKCAAYGVAQARGLRYGWVGGFAKVDNRFGYEKLT
jgi:hypothetical protein